MEGCPSPTLDVPVAVGRGSGLRPREKVPSLLGVSIGIAFGEHLPPMEIRHGSKELGIHSGTHGGRSIEVGIGFVVAAEDSGESTEGVAHEA